MSQEGKPFLLQMSADHMLAQAREMTGIEIMDEAAVEPFRILHAAHNTDACLHEQGAIAIEKNCCACSVIACGCNGTLPSIQKLRRFRLQILSLSMAS